MQAGPNIALYLQHRVAYDQEECSLWTQQWGLWLRIMN